MTALLILQVAVLTPLVVFYSVKLGRFAWRKADLLFDSRYPKRGMRHGEEEGPEAGASVRVGPDPSGGARSRAETGLVENPGGMLLP